MTTTALGMAVSWPRPALLVEADPTGGSGLLAGFFRGVRDYSTGLVELALSPVDIADALADVAHPIEGSQVRFIAGTRSHRQASGLGHLWEPLADELSDLEPTGQDVIVDAGRLGLSGSPEPLLASADLTLLATGTSLPALAAARSWAETVTESGAWRQPGLLVIGDRRPYPATTAADTLGLPLVATIAHDPRAAAVYHEGADPPKRFDTSVYVRSLRSAVAAIQAQVARRRLELGEVVT